MDTVNNYSQMFQIFLSSAVIAALVTSIFSYLASRDSNKRLFAIEIMKRESELTTFRYLKIYNAIEEISKLPEIDYSYLKPDGEGFVQDKELFKNVISQTVERFNSVFRIFERVKPLMDEAYLTTITSAMKEEEMQSSLLVHALYTDETIPEGVDVVTLAEARRDVEFEITNALGRQVSSLTKATSILTEI